MAKLKKDKITAKNVKHKKEPDWPYDYDIHGMPLDQNHPCYKPPRLGKTYLKYPKGILLAKGEAPETMTSTSPYRLDRKIEAFLNTKDPMTAVQCLKLCHEQGVYPPPAVMAFLNNGIAKYLEERGKVQLDACLGLEKKRFSNKLGARQRHRLQKYYEYWLNMWAWQRVFGVSEIQAKSLVCSLPSMIKEAPKLKKDYVRKLKKDSEWLAIQAETQEDFESFYLDGMRDEHSRQVDFVSDYSITLIKKLGLPLRIQKCHREYQGEGEP